MHVAHAHKQPAELQAVICSRGFFKHDALPFYGLRDIAQNFSPYLFFSAGIFHAACITDIIVLIIYVGLYNLFSLVNLSSKSSKLQPVTMLSTCWQHCPSQINCLVCTIGGGTCHWYYHSYYMNSYVTWTPAIL